MDRDQGEPSGVFEALSRIAGIGQYGSRKASTGNHFDAAGPVV